MEVLEIVGYSLAGLLIGYFLPKIGWDLATQRESTPRHDETIDGETVRGIIRNAVDSVRKHHGAEHGEQERRTGWL